MMRGPCRESSVASADVFSLIKGSSSSIQFKVSTTNGRPPIGPGWIRQIKHDGYRLMVRRDHARVHLLTRNGDNWSARFPLILEPQASCGRAPA